MGCAGSGVPWVPPNPMIWILLDKNPQLSQKNQRKCCKVLKNLKVSPNKVLKQSAAANFFWAIKLIKPVVDLVLKPSLADSSGAQWWNVGHCKSPTRGFCLGRVLAGLPHYLLSGWWWLEPWNFEWLSSQLGMENHPSWRTPSFFRGVGLNHQPATVHSF